MPLILLMNNVKKNSLQSTGASTNLQCTRSPLHSLEFRVISPVEDKEEAEKFWHSLKQHEREYEMQQKAKNKAFELIAKNIEGWWD